MAVMALTGPVRLRSQIRRNTAASRSGRAPRLAWCDNPNAPRGARITFTGKDGVTPVDYKFKFSELRQSAGFAVQWLAPLGIFRFSFGFPLNKKRGDAVHFADETEGFQFTVGSAF